MLRSLGAILAGFVVATILVMACTFIAVATMLPPAGPGQMPEPTLPYLAVNLGYSLLAAFVGGEVAARLAPRAPLGHAMALGVILLVLGIGSAALTSAGTQGSQPGWYLYAVATLGWIGASMGGWRRAHGSGPARAP